MRFRVLHHLAKAIVKHGVKFLFNLAPGGGAVYDIATDVVEDDLRAAREDALRIEVQALAQAPAEQVQQEVEAAVQAEAAGQPAEVRQALTAYLAQVPAAMRRSLRRPSDPSGTTVPATRALSRPEDLMALLPPRPPRFRPGDRPLPQGKPGARLVRKPPSRKKQPPEKGKRLLEQKTVEKPPRVPLRYGRFQETPLRVEVHSGPQTLDFNIP